MHDDTGAQYDALTQGAGGLNAAGAVALAANLDTRISVGQSWLSSGIVASTTIGGQAYAWGQNIGGGQ